MKPMIPTIYKKQIIPLMIFITLSLAIWYIGPLLAIANHTPLIQPEKRLYIIVAIFLLWLLKFILLDTAPQNVENTAAYSSETIKNLQNLQGRFQGALDFLKKTIINKHGTNLSLAKLPWYLLIGPANAGKTTLLANSNINFILSKQVKQGSAIPSSDACDWWVTRDLVMVDVPGFYFATRKKPTPKNQPSTASFLWNTLLNLIHAAPCKEQLNGIVIALHLPELMKKPTRQERSILIQDLKKQILELRAKFGPHLPFHLVITKCDLLPGFAEFFSESGGDELSQSWGITLPALQPQEKLLDVFIHRFNALIKRLNKQLIWRLHQERNSTMRPYIKDFPLHVERLKESIANILKGLLIPDLCLQGIYLTSATQMNSEEATNYLPNIVNSLTHQAMQIMRAPLMPNRVYFIKQLILQNLLHSVDYRFTTHKDYSWQDRAIYATSISVIIAAALLLGHDFQHGVQQAYSIQNDLARYQFYIQQPNQENNRLTKALPLLNALQQAAETHRPLSQLKNLLSFYSHKSQETANAVYHQALQTIVIPEVKNALEKYLSTASNKNPVPVYNALKTYLMLANTENRQATFIANTANKIIAIPLNKRAMNQLTNHIRIAFSNTFPAMNLDQNLINQVRKQLINLPSNELGLIILKNMGTNNTDSSIGLGTNFGNPPIFVSKTVANQIPNMFIANNFQKITTEEIAQAANEALKGNWVLGEIIPSANQSSTESLITQLHNQYLANYVDIWESQLANIQPYTPKNLLQTDEMIQTLTSNNSPLLQLLQTIQQNTSFPMIQTASPKIRALNNLLAHNDNNQQNSLYDIFVNLNQLHAYLQTILATTNVNKAAFTAASERVQNPTNNPITATRQLAMQSPEPLKTWLNTIANESWKFVLQEAAEHVENAWQTDIVPTYNAHILNHYPFNPTSVQEVNLQQLTRFLGHHGTLATFYQTYLKSFVNDTAAQWTWKSIDDQRIPLSNNVLKQFQHAAQIQHAFFPNEDNKLSVEFALRPIMLAPGTKSFTLNINGQQVTYVKNAERTPHTLAWPGNQAQHATTMHFVSQSNQLNSNTFKGDWGWFKLVNSATQNINSRKELSLTFTVNGHSAKYLLLTQGHMNPFLPLNLTRFELPQELVE